MGVVAAIPPGERPPVGVLDRQRHGRLQTSEWAQDLIEQLDWERADRIHLAAAPGQSERSDRARPVRVDAEEARQAGAREHALDGSLGAAQLDLGLGLPAGDVEAE